MPRSVRFYQQYFLDFYETQKSSVQLKIDYVLRLLSELEQIPEKFLKHLEGTKGLYEIRIKSGHEIYRIFCFFEEGQIIILLNAFQKKSQKTPKRELERAERLRKDYYEEKKQSNQS